MFKLLQTQHHNHYLLLQKVYYWIYGDKNCDFIVPAQIKAGTQFNDMYNFADL